MGRLDRPALGMVLMLGFCATAPFSDAMGKIAAQDFPILQLVAIRFVVQAAILVPLVWVLGQSWRMSRLGWGLTLTRTLLQIAGIWLMTKGLTYLPLADAIAIAFVMPFILLLMGHWILGETVGPRRMAACAVGFVGTLMVMQPSFREVGWAVLYPLAVAFVFAAFMLVTRRLSAEAEPMPMQATSGLMALAGLAAVYLLLPDAGPFALRPVAGHLPILLAMGIAGTCAHLLMTWSLRFAPSATLAPMQYLEIPMAALIGLAIFGDWPNGLALAGIGVTVATGLYILWRGRAA
ncbi:DMT family transporter [Jannaschia ovalis]|uniref:DMT family transporter n=1 Tax=Jannaschia ovalis TaxID=3038773 RepID=A0ABY8LB21_9RHOB|nr:DMT family transporter [Jannaschia sp. GRR-S6-38]WGH78471.1 DMT family transporter [Jannaschia sp. GRR-S6-38]